MADYEPILADPNSYPIDSKDFEEVNISADHLGTELYNDKKGYLDVYTKETLLEKYVAWCNKFKEPYPLAEADHSTIVMIFGIPTVDASKADKLLKLILHLCDKKFKSQAFLKKEINIDNLRPILIPNSDKPGQFLPAAFIPCRVNSIAEHVSVILDGTKIGSKNTMSCVVLQDVGSCLSNQDHDEYEPVTNIDLICPQGLTSHLDDTMGREQFMVATTELSTFVMWNDPVLKMPQKYLEAPITCVNSTWSVNGAYLFTMHKKGVKVRGGSKLNDVGYPGLPHDDVWEVLCSPDETHLLTWNGLSNSEGSHRSVIIYNLYTGNPVQSMWCPPISCDGSEWHPFFCWSPCSRYLACNDGFNIQILQAPTFEPVCDEDGVRWTIPIKNPRSTFAWSPTDPFLAVWSPPMGTDKVGRGEGPCSLKVINVTRKRDMASKSLNVELDKLAEIVWHPQGNFLTIKLDILQKVTKKTRKPVTQIEVFHMRVNGCPSSSILVPTATSQFHHCAFEPMGERFAILTSDSVKIWSLHRDATRASSQEICSHDLGGSRFNKVYWSPQGTFFVLAGIDSSGSISFNSIRTDSSGACKVDESHHDTHYAMNKITWDHSGRYLASVVKVEQGRNTDFSKASESSYRIWTFQGKEITTQKDLPGSIIDFMWRPHPKPVLSQEKIMEVKTNVNKYGSKYHTDDDAMRSAALSEVENANKSMIHKFQSQLEIAASVLAGDAMASQWESSWKEYENACCEFDYIDVEETGLLGTETRIIKAAETTA